MREPEGRQDRFRGGSVKSVRFSDPRCLPSPGARDIRGVRKHETDHELSSSNGVHVMRIAVPRRTVPLFPRAALALSRPVSRRCSRRVVPHVARLPSTRLLPRPSFRPDRDRGRVSLSPKTTYRLLQTDDARALNRRGSSPRSRRRATLLLSYVRSCSLLRVHASDEPRDAHASEEACVPWTGRPERRFDSSFDERGPSSKSTAHLIVVRASA